MFIKILSVQELPEEGPATERHQDPAEELCCLPQPQELAVVEAIHQSEALVTGQGIIKQFYILYVTNWL